MEHIFILKDNYILKRIILECLRNNGAAFTLDGKFFLQFHWSKVYTAKRSLFGLRWAFERYDGGYEELKRAKNLLSELPAGITYQEKDIIERKLSEQRITTFGTAWESHVTSFSLYVPTDYSQMIVNQNNGHRIVVIGYFKNSVWQEALQFKERVLSSHPNILDPLFRYGFSQSLCLTNYGFTNYDCNGYSLQSVNMKPLQNEAQKLGLMLAIGEFGEKLIPENQIWFIDNFSSDDIDVQKVTITTPPQLNEW